MKRKAPTTSYNLTPEDLSNRWNINIGTLANWRHKKQGPRFFKAGRKVLYRFSDIEDYEKNNLVN